MRRFEQNSNVFAKGAGQKIAEQPGRADQWRGGPGNGGRGAPSRWIVSIVNESFHPDLDATGLSYH
jgi:hypothetical protein